MLSPFTLANALITSPKEQIRQQIQTAFSSYLSERNLKNTVQPSNSVFKSFISSNPDYKNLLEKYTNITKEEISAKLPTSSPDLSIATIGTPNKVMNATVDDKTYNVTIRKGHSAGQEFTVVNFCANGTDPWIYLSVDYLTINLLGWIITYGEVDSLIYHVYANETGAFLTFFDQTVLTTAAVNAAYWAVAGYAVMIAIGLAGGQYGAKIGTAVTTAGTIASTYDMSTLSSVTHDAVDSSQLDHGLKIKLVSTYIYPWAISITQLPDLAIYVYHFWDGSWYKAFPMTPYWSFTSLLAEEMIAYEISQVVHTMADYTVIGYNHWTWSPDPPPPGQPPSNPYGVNSVTINSYDTTHSTGLSGATIEIDGFEVGTTSSNFFLTPETHVVGGFHLPHFLYENLAGYPPEEPEGPTLVEITSDVTITMNYEAKAPLYVNAYEPSTSDIVGANIYISGQPVGFGEFYEELPLGTYSISVDYQAIHWGELVTVDYIMVNEEFYSYGGSIEISLPETYTSITFVYRFGE
jgi:hypothetical protein